MKKNLIKFLFCLLAFITTAVQAAPDQNKYLDWHSSHFNELQYSIQTYLENYSLHRLLQPGPTTFNLASHPEEIKTKDANHYITIISGKFSQADVELFALFFVQQQVNPYLAKPMLVYTCNDELSMPSMRLYLDVLKHPFIQERDLPENFKVHINALQADSEGRSFQEWTFYNDETCDRVQIIFAPDEDGGTDYEFVM